MAALFLIVGMAVQFIVSYRQAKRHVQESIDLKMQIAHEKVLFELYNKKAPQPHIGITVQI
ncbi:MAG: hypothetical protein IJT74_05120 [Bacteroidales bacterium]|nr:hypothetical protein [Bacteroidales bacterium]